MTIEEMLENRHLTRLYWCDPWPACGPEGNELIGHVKMSATVHDCVNMGRNFAKKHGKPTNLPDREYLLDWIAVQLAEVDYSSTEDECQEACQACLDEGYRLGRKNVLTENSQNKDRR